MRLEYLKNVSSIRIKSPEKCTGCAMCTEVCPHQVLAIVDKKVRVVRRDACMECGACKKNCPAGVIEVKTGVGCAAAIIQGMLTNSEPTCGCSTNGKKTTGCAS